jgi:hypothetical protein
MDSGDTWTDVSGNLEENPDGTGAGPGVYGVEIYPSDPPQYFVGTSAGLYSTNALDSTSTIWQMEGANTIGNVIINQINSRPYDGLLVVGTHGNGIWTTHLEPAVGIGYNAEDWKKDWRVYPTQVRDILKFEAPIHSNGKVTIRMYDLSGQLIIEDYFQAEKKLHQINTQHLTSGMYLFVIENNGKKTTGKIIHE